MLKTKGVIPFSPNDGRYTAVQPAAVQDSGTTHGGTRDHYINVPPIFLPVLLLPL